MKYNVYIMIVLNSYYSFLLLFFNWPKKIVINIIVYLVDFFLGVINWFIWIFLDLMGFIFFFWIDLNLSNVCHQFTYSFCILFSFISFFLFYFIFCFSFIFIFILVFFFFSSSSSACNSFLSPSRPQDTIPIHECSGWICIIPVSPPKRSAAQLLAGI